jgi:opacity protein-like surface antigen
VTAAGRQPKNLVPSKTISIGRRWPLAATLVALLTSPLAGWSWAQDRVPEAGQDESPSWRFTFTPDLWMSGLTGSVGIGPAVSEVDLSFGDIFEHFDIGVMGLFEARRHPWVIRTDLFYVSLSDQQALSVGSGSTLQVNQNQFMIQPELGYTIVSRPWGGVDALIGVRYWHLNVDLSAQPQERTGEEDWADGTVGANLRYQPAERWHLFAKSDVGAGGSDFTWQALGGAAYDVGRCCTLVAAYRYLDVDYRKDGGLVYDVHLDGPAIGVTLHF